MKLGRNEPCPCGSGKKYKQCCLGSARLEFSATIDPQLTPAQLVQARCTAFQRGDFGFIYDSYHPDSPFRSLYPQRQAYLRQGQGELLRDYRIDECRVLREEIGGSQARVLFYLVTSFQGAAAETFELSSFLPTAAGWRYLSSQKLERQEFAGALEEIDWEAFDRVKDRIFF
jgi:SEC-C motif-containing protein